MVTSSGDLQFAPYMLLHIPGLIADLSKGTSVSKDLSWIELRKILAEAINQSPESEDVEGLLQALDRAKLYRYHKDESVSLLTTAGKVLIAILEDPTLTQRAIAVYLGCSAALVDRHVQALVDAKLITKTKVGRSNVYRADVKNIKSHSDIHHLSTGLRILDLMSSASQEKDEQQPSGYEEPF